MLLSSKPCQSVQHLQNRQQIPQQQYLGLEQQPLPQNQPQQFEQRQQNNRCVIFEDEVPAQLKGREE